MINFIRRLQIIRNQKTVLCLILFILINLIFFWKFVFLNMIPIPGDILLGAYYPWLNNHWGGISTVFPVKNPAMSDIFSLLYPWRLLAINYFKAGSLPLWDSTSFLGTSLIGNFQAAIFNPFNLLFSFPARFNFIWGLQVFIQPLLAMICMYLLLKKWGLNVTSSIFGAIAYAFSGQMLMWVEYNLLGFIISVFPLFFLILNEFITSKKIIHLLWLSLLIGYCIFAGYPQMLYYALFFGFIYLIIDFNTKSLKIFIKISLLFVFFVTLGLGLSGLQIIPGIEALNHSIRNLDMVATNNSVVFLPLQNLITIFEPDFFGNPVTANYWGIGSYETFTFYASVVALFLVTYSFFNKQRRRLVILMAAFAIFGFIYSVKNPLSELVQNISFLGLKGSVNSRILFIWGFAISILSAFGFEELMKEVVLKGKYYTRSLYAISPYIGITLGIILCIVIIKTGGHGIDYEQVVESGLNQLQVPIRNLIFPFLVIIISLIIVFSAKILNRPVLLKLLLLILLIDSFRFGWKYLPWTKENLIFPVTPSIEYLMNIPKPSRIAIEKSELLTANTWSTYNLESISGYNILLPKETAQYISFLNNGKANSESARFLDIKNFDSKLLDLANVEYIIVLLRKLGVPDTDGTLPHTISRTKFTKVFQEKGVAILKNNQSMNRIFSMDKYIVIPGQEKALMHLSDDAFKINEEVILEKSIKQESNLGKCLFQLDRYNGQSYLIHADCASDTIMVVTDYFHPGWQALINGKPAELIRADGNFMALFVSKGQSTIELEYKPQSFVQGLILSAGSLVVIVLFYFLIRFRLIQVNL